MYEDGYVWQSNPDASLDISQVFGRRLTNFLLNDRSAAEVESTGSHDERVLLSKLRELARAAVTIKGDDERDELIFGALLGSPRVVNVPNLACEIRLSMGGYLPVGTHITVSSNSDYLHRWLIEASLAVMPLYLTKGRRFREWSDTPLRRSNSYLQTLPVTADFFVALMADSDFGTLLQERTDPNTVPADFFAFTVGSSPLWSTGGGGTLRLADLPDTFCTYMLNLITIRGLAYDQIPDLALEVAEVARTLARGEKARVYHMIGASGLSIPEGKTLTIARAELYSATGCRHVLPPDTQAVSAVALIPYDVQWIGDTSQGLDNADEAKLLQKVHAANSRTYTEINNLWTNVCLAAVLCSPDMQAPITLEQLVATSMNPLGQDGVGYSAASMRWPRYVDNEENNFRSLEESANTWIHTLSTLTLTRQLELGARRLLLAGGRIDDTDAFVDALVCWEALFGSSGGEVSFKVAGSLCVLLEPDDKEKRATLFKQLKDLYAARSKVVHGDAYDPSKVRQWRLDAVRICILAFRAILVRPELTGLTSDARGKAVILNI